MNTIQKLKDAIFSDVPFFPGDGYFAVGTDSIGRQVIVACRNEQEALFKKTLLNELLAEQEKVEIGPIFEIDDDDGPYAA